MATEPPGPGTELLGGRYRLVEVLGTGGMAIVWRATDQRLGRTVAIKVIADTLAADPAYLERFTREARTAAGLSHRNLVPVYDYAAGAERPFLVMELVEGGTLADRIERGPIEAAEATAVARDLLSALGCVHDAGILHRDIKPANVLLGSDGRARLTDFGIAHPEDATRLTQTGHLIGTIRYLAPELVQGDAPSVRSDLYALGVLVRELAGDALEGDLRALVEALTDPEPARRPASASDALAALAVRAAAAGARGAAGRVRAGADRDTAAAPRGGGATASAAARQPGGGAGHRRRDRHPAGGRLRPVARRRRRGRRRRHRDRAGGTAAGAPPITLEGRLDQLDRIIRGEAP